MSTTYTDGIQLGALPLPAQAVEREDVPLLVSVHLPKTAGTSFSSALQSRYGARYLADYGDLPMHSARLQRHASAIAHALSLRGSVMADTDCIHGHFLPAKFRMAGLRRRVGYLTWVRDPVERIASHYHFWRRDYDGSDPLQPMRNRMLAEDWSLERFALGPEFRNLYRQYLWRFDPSLFDFVGITEHYEDDLDRLATQYLKGDLAHVRDLVNPNREDDCYGISRDLRSRIEEHHAHDVALYRWARRRAGR